MMQLNNCSFGDKQQALTDKQQALTCSLYLKSYSGIKKSGNYTKTIESKLSLITKYFLLIPNNIVYCNCDSFKNYHIGHEPKRFRFMVFNSSFNDISVISWQSVLFGGRKRNSRRKSPTCRNSLTSFITYCCIEELFKNLPDQSMVL